MNTDFQKIYGLISKHLPKNWESVAIYFAIVDNMFDFKYYVNCGNGYVDCFNLKEYDDISYKMLAINLKKTLSLSRDTLPKEKQWSVFTMFVNCSGKFNVDYLYDNISDIFVPYRKEWEKTYINRT